MTECVSLSSPSDYLAKGIQAYATLEIVHYLGICHTWWPLVWAILNWLPVLFFHSLTEFLRTVLNFLFTLHSARHSWIHIHGIDNKFLFWEVSVICSQILQWPCTVVIFFLFFPYILPILFSFCCWWLCSCYCTAVESTLWMIHWGTEHLSWLLLL